MDMFLLLKKDWQDLRNKKGSESEPFKNYIHADVIYLLPK